MKPWRTRWGADGAILPVLAVIFLATLIRSAFGFGEALVAVPLLALLIPVEEAVPLATLVSITVAGIVVSQDWHKIHFRSAGWLVFSTLFGIPLGLWVLTAVTETVVKAILAVVIIGFSSYCLVSRRPYQLQDDCWAWVGNFGGSLAATAPGASRHAARHATNAVASRGRLGRIAPLPPNYRRSLRCARLGE